MTISINVLIFAIIEVAWFIYAIQGDDYDAFIGSSRDWRMFYFILGSIILTLIWGGIFWW